jgi:hypothetical protein
VEDEHALYPESFCLEQNFPNPFKSKTNISWYSPVGCRQTLKVYNISGKEIATLIDGYIPTGKHKTEFNGASFPDGMYFYELRAGVFIVTKKIIVLK